MRKLTVGAVIVAAALVGCGGGSGPTGPGGGGNSIGGPMTASIDGVAWSSNANTSIVSTSAQLAGLYVISGTQSNATTSRIITLSLQNIPGPGTYPLGTGGGVSGGNGVYAESTGGWSTPLSGEAGTVTISTLTSTRLVGTFSFAASTGTSGATGTRNITNGKFDLPITTPVNNAVTNANRNRITATIGGQSYVAASVALQQNPAALFGFASANVRYGVSLTIQALPGPGTYALGAQGGVTTAVGVSGECSPGGPSTCAWGNLPGASGTVTVTTMANGRATGTFSASLVRAAGAGAATISVTNGAFDIGLP